MFSKVLGVVALLVSANAMADYFFQQKPIPGCNASLYLNDKNQIGQPVVLHFQNLNALDCRTMDVYDTRADKVIGSFAISGTTYNLTPAMLNSFKRNCRLGVAVSGSNRNGSFSNYVVFEDSTCTPTAYQPPVYQQPVYRPQPAPQPYRYNQNTGYQFQWSQKGNCKLIKGDRHIKNLPEHLVHFCRAAGIQDLDVATYEWAPWNNNQCIIRVNGNYRKDTTPFFCNAEGI